MRRRPIVRARLITDTGCLGIANLPANVELPPGLGYVNLPNGERFPSFVSYHGRVFQLVSGPARQLERDVATGDLVEVLEYLYNVIVPRVLDELAIIGQPAGEDLSTTLPRK